MMGHRVVIEATLKSECEGGLRGPIIDGHRSVAYGFENLDPDGEPVFFGALVERVCEGGEPGGRLVAVLRFYHELAEIYATPGAECQLDYGRVVGDGRVIAVLAPFGSQEYEGGDEIDSATE